MTGLGCLLVVLGWLQDPWAQIWSELGALRAGGLPAAEAEPLQARLTSAWHAATSGPRRELLRAELDALAGQDVRGAARALAELEPLPFEGPELWFLVDLLPVGARRQELLLAALRATPELARWQVLLAWSCAVEEARSLRFESALPVQEELHARYQADWSTTDLALTYRQLGRREDLEALFRASLARSPSGELWAQYANAALGSGDERRARDALGRALALGSTDAALVLGRLDLVSGRLEAARTGFRVLILDAPPPDWAWRGWGTTLLPAPFSSAVTISTQTPIE